MASSVGFSIDVIAVVLGSGGTIRQAIAAVAREGPPPVRLVFHEIVARSERGDLLVDALAAASGPLGPSFHPLLGALVDAEVGGASISTVLARLADDLESRERWQSEAAAGRVSVAVLPPLVLCLLPAVIIGAVVPVAIVALRHLDW